MKYLLSLLTLLISASLFAQDVVRPLISNPSLINTTLPKVKAASNTFDSTIVYLTDTLVLPFFDDFSRDKFQNYVDTIDGLTMGDSLFFRLLNTTDSTAFSSDAKFTDIKTYRSIYDPVQDTSTLIYFDSTEFLFDDLNAYPPNYHAGYGFPAYIIYDTLVSGNQPDTVGVTTIQYLQDSARIFFDTIQEPNKLWLNRAAYHNYRFAINPWSLGVVTFDGLDATGYPYNFASVYNAVADTLLAKPMDLSINSPADSIYFSFLYQEGGYGNAPENTDSLFLDFYSPQTGMWKRVWRVSGGGSTDDFKVAHIPIKDPIYFQKGFQFRFMNYGSVAGALDHFHIDFVTIRTMSGVQDTLFKDFAIVYPIASLLKNYTAVPWKHYQNNPTGKMGDSVEIVVRNGSELTENNQVGSVKVYFNGVQKGNFTLNAAQLSGGNINYAPRTVYASYHDFSTGYSFDPLTKDTMAIFDYEGIATAQFPNDPVNDTTFGQQVFRNYYAYDDGTAEKAYGVIGEQSLLAVKFKAYQPDSLVAVQIHFVPTVEDVSQNLFLLTVWNDNNGKPGDTLYQDLFYYPQQPVYTHGPNQYKTYYFRDTQKVAVPQTFYVGMRQIDEEGLNIGFDANNDNSGKIFWSSDNGGNWYNASYPGTVMIRPVITSKMDYLLGVKKEQITASTYSFSIYPNPTQNQLHFSTDYTGKKVVYEIRDLNGRLIQSVKENSTDVSQLQNGIYIVTQIIEDIPLETKKLVIY